MELSPAALWPHYATVGINYTGQDAVILMVAAQCAGCQRGISQSFLLQGRDRYLGRASCIARKELYAFVVL